jgi:hypothetical protein
MFSDNPFLPLVSIAISIFFLFFFGLCDYARLFRRLKHEEEMDKLKLPGMQEAESMEDVIEIAEWYLKQKYEETWR